MLFCVLYTPSFILAVQGVRAKIFRFGNVYRAGRPWHVISTNPKHVVLYNKVGLVTLLFTRMPHEINIKFELHSYLCFIRRHSANKNHPSTHCNKILTRS